MATVLLVIVLFNTGVETVQNVSTVAHVAKAVHHHFTRPIYRHAIKPVVRKVKP